ncbi:MAG: hypothetical protein ACI9VR_000858 [Cognaticolwellia sp.]
MKTGDLVLDAQGRSYQIGPLLGRGLWGKSYLVRHGDSRAEFVLKCPLGRDDFRGDVQLTDTLIKACVTACTEQGELLGRAEHVFLPPLQSRASEDGSPLLILPRFTTTLDRRIAQGCSMAEVLSVLIATLDHLKTLEKDLGAHGNLRPSNILLNDRGDVLLMDMATPAARKALGQLHAISPEPHHYLPHEVLAGGTLSTAADTYAAAAILYRAVFTQREGDAEGKTLTLPTKGLDKAALVELKNRATTRLQDEDSNPRFHVRFAERLASVLNRAMSEQTHPSPPYRFNRLEELRGRLEELRTLIRPQITSVGKVLLNRPPGSTTYETDEEIAYSVTVGASSGVSNYEEIACGIALFDAETEDRLREVETRYTCEDHPSGRYRFRFDLVGLHPGRYRARMAFAIRDSGHPPQTAEANFEVRAAAGYVPPQPESKPQPLPFGRKEHSKTAVTEPFGQNLSQDAQSSDAPRPIAPPADPVSRPPGINVASMQTPGLVVPTLELNPPGFDDEEPPTVALPPPAQRPGPVVTLPSFDDVPAPPVRPLPTANPDMDAPSSPGMYAQNEATEPKVQRHTQLPDPDPLHDIVGAGSWTDVPLPGAAQDPLSPPMLDDGPEPDSESTIERYFEMLKADPFLMAMSAGGVFLFVLLFILVILRLT